MPTIKVKPTTNARRQLSYLDRSDVDKNVKREKALTIGKKRLSGRNHAGQIVVAHRGGAAKKLYRIIDFSGRDRLEQTALVTSIQYDPNRTANIALIQYEDGEKSYIIAPTGLKKGTSISFGEKAPIKIGNRMKIKSIPASTQIHNIEMVDGKGGQLCRSAGSFATLLGVDEKYAILRLPSGSTRKVMAENYASIGIVSNIDHSNVVIGKAGRARKLGRRPVVLGKSKNPVDHPHGGGEGHTSIGLKGGPKTPWGKPALGPRTRNKKNPSSKLILSRRKK